MKLVKKSLSILTAFGIPLASAGILYAQDKIILKNEQVIEGKIIEEKGDQVIIELSEGKVRMGIPRADILEIVMKEPEEFVKAKDFFNQGKFEEAIKSYNSVFNQYGTTEWGEEALKGIGLSYERQGKLDDAIGAFQNFLKRYRDSGLSYEVKLHLAGIFRKKGMSGKAEQIYAEIVEGNSSGKDIQEALSPLGEIYFEAGEFEKALMSFLRIVVVYGSNTKLSQKAMLKSGHCYEELNDPGNAKRIYEELLTEHPEGEYAKEAGEKLSKLEEKK